MKCYQLGFVLQIELPMFDQQQLRLSPPWQMTIER